MSIFRKKLDPHRCRKADTQAKECQVIMLMDKFNSLVDKIILPPQPPKHKTTHHDW